MNIETRLKPPPVRSPPVRAARPLEETAPVGAALGAASGALSVWLEVLPAPLGAAIGADCGPGAGACCNWAKAGEAAITKNSRAAKRFFMTKTLLLALGSLTA